MASDVNKPSKKKEPSEFQQEYLCDSCQLCTSDPFWKNLKFEQVDILSVFLEANREGIECFSVPQFRKVFNNKSKFLREKTDATFIKVLNSLVSKNYLLKIPCFQLYWYQIQLNFETTLSRKNITNLRNLIKHLGSLCDLRLTKDRRGISFYYNPSLIDPLILTQHFEKVNLCVQSHIILPPPYSTHSEHTIVNKRIVHALNPQKIDLIKGIVDSISIHCPLNLHSDCYLILDVLQQQYPSFLSKKQISEEYGNVFRTRKCIRGINDRLNELQNFNLISHYKDEFLFFSFNKKDLSKNSVKFGMNSDHPLNSFALTYTKVIKK